MPTDRPFRFTAAYVAALALLAAAAESQVSIKGEGPGQVPFTFEAYANNVKALPPLVADYQLGISRFRGSGVLKDGKVVSGSLTDTDDFYIPPARSMTANILGGTFTETADARFLTLTVQITSSSHPERDCGPGLVGVLELKDSTAKLANGHPDDYIRLGGFSGDCVHVHGWNNEDPGPRTSPPVGGPPSGGQWADVRIGASPSFRITGVSLPSTRQANGPKGDLSVEWAGNPRFPVTMTYRPNSCPPGLNCTTVTQTFEAATNPLVFQGAVWCAGTLPAVLPFDYSVFLTDATGLKTAPADADMTCLSGESDYSIGEVSLPATRQANGPRGNLAVTWSGNPTFPVTMIYAPDSCPAGLNCTTVTQTFAASANPLVFEGAVWCVGSFSGPIFFDYSVSLQDATGKKTAKANADMTCYP